MESPNKNIEKALDLPPDRVVKEIVQKKDVAKSRFEKGVDKDYNKVRDNLFDLLDSSKDAIEGIMSVAMAGDQPRAMKSSHNYSRYPLTSTKTSWKFIAR